MRPVDCVFIGTSPPALIGPAGGRSALELSHADECSHQVSTRWAFRMAVRSSLGMSAELGRRTEGGGKVN